MTIRSVHNFVKEFRDKLWSEREYERIHQHWSSCHSFQDVVPGPYVLNTGDIRSAKVAQELDSVQTDLNDGVDKGKQRAEWERSHKHGHKAIL